MYRFGSDPAREEAVRREVEGSDFPEEVLGAASASNGGGAGGREPVPSLGVGASSVSETPSTRGVLAPEIREVDLPWPPPCEEAVPPESGTPPSDPPAKTVLFGNWKVVLQMSDLTEAPSLSVIIEPAS